MIEVATSDHLSLYLQLNKQVYQQKERRFRFENTWLRVKECLRVVKNGWEEAEGLEIIDKIRFCGIKLQELGRGGINKEYKQQIREFKVSLRRLRSRRDTQGIQLYNEVRWKYLNLLEK